MCTTIIVTKGAMADGSMVVTHSCDDELGDQRLIYIPEKNYEPGQLRPIFAEHYRYPRIVSEDRGPGYNTTSYPKTDPIGYIPQVTHTYAYFDGNYGIMNEHNLMIGECTNAANYQPTFVTENESINTGKHIRLFYSQELSRIALERCKTSRNAIKLMGELIDTYGLYSTGETLLVSDENEAWVFEMCALPNEKYHSAWVAKRVPDGEVFVAANEFRIRDILKDSDDFMYSKFLHPGIYKLGWWKESDGPIDWLKAVSPGE
ncbi:C69 family dipeptidase [Faecalimicrobium sp. JNUCC 81]